MSTRPRKVYCSAESRGSMTNRGTSVAEPGRRILLVESDRGAKKVERASGLTLREGGKAIALELSRRAFDQTACFLAQRCGKPHDPGSEIVLDEGFLGEGRSGEKQRDGKSRQKTPRAHFEDPSMVAR